MTAMAPTDQTDQPDRTDRIDVPRGFRTFAVNAGVKDTSLDLMVVAADVPCTAAGLFTRSRFAGAPVLVCREHLADGRAQAVVAISKNANVATGPEGAADCRAVVDAVAEQLDLAPTDVVIAGTGVIGRRWPMPAVLARLEGLGQDIGPADFPRVAEAIMTTDTHPKLASERVGAASVLGIAKGVGMIEPDMATLLVFLFTDAEVAPDHLATAWRHVVDRTFNRISIDTDTSTSDSAVVLANGLAGPVDLAAFDAALERVARRLMHEVLADGEGATKTIEVTVEGARDEAQAVRVGKLVVNSPLVKTAVHGADPNWGRVAMAIGKAQDDLDITPERVTIRFGDVEVYPAPADEPTLARAEALMAGTEVPITVSLGIGEAAATVWGCDLSDGYVRINADYTT
jgi:glutamate N-acetyltransferase/amino-acid N-acetyltransferase